MKIKATSVEDYCKQVPNDKIAAFQALRAIVLKNLPEGFVEELNYGMIGYVVPHFLFPAGYHCDPSLPLPFLNLASQKNHIALYHMGLYANSELLLWFQNEYPKHSSRKLDMGKCCIRFKKMDEIPFDLIGELVEKVTVNEWIKTYETRLKK